MGYIIQHNLLFDLIYTFTGVICDELANEESFNVNKINTYMKGSKGNTSKNVWP